MPENENEVKVGEHEVEPTEEETVADVAPEVSIGATGGVAPEEQKPEEAS